MGHTAKIAILRVSEAVKSSFERQQWEHGHKNEAIVTVIRPSQAKKFCFLRNLGIKLFRIRGWGMLTGSGGFQLPAEKAIEIQEAFARYCVERLNRQEGT